MVKRAIKEFRLVSLGHITAGSKFDADPNSYRMFGSHVVLNLVGQIAKTCMLMTMIIKGVSARALTNNMIW